VEGEVKYSELTVSKRKISHEGGNKATDRESVGGLDIIGTEKKKLNDS